MASLKFRHYATENALKGTNNTVQDALNAFDVGTIVFIDDTQKQYIITSKSNNVVTYKIYYGRAAVVGVSRRDATLTLTLSDDSEITVTINNVEHATSSDTADTAKSVAWNNVTNKPNLVTTDTEQTITGAKIFNNNTTFKNETDVENLMADSLLVTGSARFTNTINGNLKGNVEGNLTGNASTATTAAICTGNSATATALTTNAGSTNIPVYFTGGKPSAISITAGTADIEQSLVVVTNNNELYKTSGITANYSKNSITATTFKGNLEGNALTATTALSCSGNSATATLANEAKNLQNTTPETKDESFFSKVVTEDADMVSFQTLKGNSVVWNQLVKKTTQGATTLNGLTFYPQENGEVLITGVATETSYASTGYYLGYYYKSVANHKAFIQLFGDATGTMKLYVTDNLQIDTNLGIVQWGTNDENSVLFIPKGYDCGQGVRLRFIVNDLTQMFGAGNEPSTVEEFLSRKPKVADEYAYNEGEIINNKVEKVVTTGRNLWDEEWEQGSINAQGLPVATTASIRSKEFNRCLPNCEICFSCQSAAAKLIYWYDVNKAFISRNEVSNAASIYGVATSPANAYFFKVRNDKSTYNHDICINLSDPAINGQYFPYEKHELDLSWVKEIKDTEGVKLFEDGMKSAGTAFDEVGKNKAVKRIGSVDLGSLNYYKGGNVWISLIPDYKTNTSNRYVNAFTTKYTQTIADNEISSVDCPNLKFYTNAGGEVGGIGIRDDAYTTAESFKAAMSGVMLYYELAEPIEVELPYGINHTLPVWKDGMMYAESSQSSTPIVCTNAYYTNIRESVKKFIGDADSIYASTSGYNAHGTWNIDISGKASSAITANSAITATSATTATTCTGNAGTATTLQNTRKINGTDFNGSADITTSKWGTARNITISDGTNSGTATSVDGSGAITLNLPGTIKANLSGNASSATKAANDGNGNTITSTYATKTERSNNDITAASLNATKLTLTRAAGNITANIPTWNQDTTGTAAKATADAKGNNIINTYATKAEVAALPKSMVIKGTLDATHALPTSGMTEGDTYIVGTSGKYNNIACKVGDFFVRTSNSWLRIPAGDEWEYNENTIKAIKVNNAGHADTADTAVSAGSATTASACTGNSATATKLQTARTIWGQSFDGSRNISGDITSTGNIRPSATKTSNLGSDALSYKYVYATWFGAPSNTAVSFGAANETHLTIGTSGNVGIGTPSPTSKLHVAGTGYFTGDTSSAANIIAGGYIKGETVKISSGCTLQYDSTQKCIRFVFS